MVLYVDRQYVLLKLYEINADEMAVSKFRAQVVGHSIVFARWHKQHKNERLMLERVLTPLVTFYLKFCECKSL